jgi:hypothetical protein
MNIKHFQCNICDFNNPCKISYKDDPTFEAPSRCPFSIGHDSCVKWKEVEEFQARQIHLFESRNNPK